ncbi:MAG: hypothetical protein NTZ86_08840 [Legionellales bacterium]|nr:hypothetical protein [Legionellales bacterium]
MRILILFQLLDGGTNVLLNRAKQWLVTHGFEVMGIEDIGWDKTRIDLVILPSSEMHRLSRILDKNNEIKSTLIWSMGILAFQGGFYNQLNNSLACKIFTFPLRVLANKLLSSLLAERAVIFTDEVAMNSDIQYLKYIPSDVNDLIFPIPIDVTCVAPSYVFPASPLRFMWIGRVDNDFKILPLLRIIRDVSSALKRGVLKGELEFTIIGSGDSEDLLQKEITLTTGIKFIWKGKVPLSELTDLLTKNVDVLFAMGTSALEGARCGIPTVIVQPFSYQKQEPSLPYRWCHQTVGHSMGEFSWVPCEPVQPKCDFDSLWGAATLDELSLKSFAFSQKFNSDDVFSRLVTRPLPKDLSSKSILLLRIHSAIYSLKRKLRRLLLCLRSPK